MAIRVPSQPLAPPVPELPPSQRANPLDTQPGTQASTQPLPQTGPTAAGNATQTNVADAAPVPGINTTPRSQMNELLSRIAPPPVSLPGLGALPNAQPGEAQASGAPLSPRRPLPMPPSSMPSRPPPVPTTPRPSRPQASGSAPAHSAQMPEGPPPPTYMPPPPPQTATPQAALGGPGQAGQLPTGPDAPQDAPPPLPLGSPRGYDPRQYAASQRRLSQPGSLMATASFVTLGTRPGSTAATTGVTAASAITTTTSTTSTPSTTAMGTASTAVKEEEGRGRQRSETTGKKRRGKSQETLRLAIVDLPVKLTAPGKVAEKLARGESGDFASIATRKADPVYRLEIRATKYRKCYQREWRPLLLVMAGRLDEAFRQTEALVAQSKQWKDLIAQCDKLADEAAGAKSAGRGMPSRDLNKIPAVKQLAALLLQPILDAVRGEGNTVQNSILGPAWLNFLLELDRQHTANWEGRSRRLLEFQILYFEIEALQKALTTTTFPDMNTQFSMLQKLKEASMRWAQNQHARKAEGEDGQAELEALDKLTKGQLRSPEQLDKLREQLQMHDAEFRETRHLALQAFIGIRGLSTVFAARHDDDERPLKALSGLLAYFLAESPLISRILQCTDQERSAIAKAAKGHFLSLQEEWKKQLSNEKSAARVDKLLARMKSESSSTAEKESEKPDALDTTASSTSSPKPASPTKPKRASQPNSLQRPDREARRKHTLERFLREEGIAAALTQLKADSPDATVLNGLCAHLQELTKTATHLNKQILLQAASDYLIGYMEKTFKPQPSGALPGVVISKLKGELTTSLAELKKLADKDSTGPEGKRESGKED